MRFGIIMSGLTLFACQQYSDPGMLSDEQLRQPENALRGMQVAEGLQVKLFASEPMVRNATNMDIDDRGRVWITEGVNYRPKDNPDNIYQEGGDQIVILEDTDQDGVADSRKVFYQGPDVDVALGICVLGNKVIVSCSPEIMILTDTDGDDKADKKELLFSGISGHQGDHAVHAAVFGPDGKLYFNFGNSGHQIMDKDGNPVIDVFGHEVNDKGNPYRQGMAFRCNLDGSEFEVLGHNFRNNYELALDSYGSIWQSDNDDDGNKAVRINYVMEYGNFGYRDELTGEGWNRPRTSRHPEIPQAHWHQNDPGVVPNLLITGGGSPCGIAVYEGDLLPEIFRNQILHTDAGPGVTRAYPVKKAGAGFTSKMVNLLHRNEQRWYRPTDVCTAPDGSVMIADWYDPGVGGHWAGDYQQGRIYRVAPDVDRYEFESPDVTTAAGAVKALQSPNLATRYLAWTALDEMGAKAAPELKELWQHSNSRLRARALWLLARLEASGQDFLKIALTDHDPDIRLTAIRAARQSMPDQLPEILKAMQHDPAPEVRREIAIALKQMTDENAASDIWAELALQHDGKDRWYLEALGIGADGRWDACFAKWLAKVPEEDRNSASTKDIIWRSRSSETLDHLIGYLKDPALSIDDAARMLRATHFLDSPNKNKPLAELLTMERPQQADYIQLVLSEIDPAFVRKSPTVRNAIQDILPQIKNSPAYLDLVQNLELKDQSDELMALIYDKPDHELGVRAANIVLDWNGLEAFEHIIENGTYEQKFAVIQVLTHIGGKPKNLLMNVARNTDQPMTIRRAAVESAAFDWGWEDRMTNLIQDEELPAELKTLAAAKLLMAHQPTVRQVAMDYLEGSQKLQEGWPPIASMVKTTGNSESGKVAFEAQCGICHQVNGQGISFGPDLSEIGNKLGKDGLLLSILNPDAGISFGYEGVVLTLKDDRKYAGYIVSESATAIDLRMNGGINQKVEKTEIAAREVMENSLMPPNLHLVLGQEKLLDVVEYLSTLKNPGALADNPFQGQIKYERTQK